MAEQRIDPKLVELILYITQRCAADTAFGAVKLNHLLYFSDFLSYGRLGASITAQEYIHQPDGPAPRDITQVRDDMVKRGELAMRDIEFVFGNRKQRPINLRPADTSLFTAVELALVDEVIDSLETLSANEVGWRATRDGQAIPYGTIFISNRPLTQAEQLRGRQLMQEIEESGRLPTSFERLRNAS